MLPLSILWVAVIDRAVIPGCAGCAMAHPDFGRSVNPISTRGDRLCPPIYRPCNGPAYNGCRHLWRVSAYLCWMILFVSYPFICFRSANGRMERLKCKFHFPNYYCSRNLSFCQKSVVKLTGYSSHYGMTVQFCPSASISSNDSTAWQCWLLRCIAIGWKVSRRTKILLCCWTAVRWNPGRKPHGLNFFLRTTIHHIVR